MGRNKMSAMAIIAVILGAAGLGVGAYSVISVQSGAVKGEDGDDGDDGSNGLIGPPGTIGLVVGIWESLSEDTDNPDHNNGMSNYLIEVSDMKIYNIRYITLNQSAQHFNTRFHLIKRGWYRVNILMLLDVVTDTTLYVIKNGTYYVLYADYAHATGLGLYHVNSEFYLISNGKDYYEFNMYSGNSDIYTTHQLFHQLGIEYVGDY